MKKIAILLSVAGAVFFLLPVERVIAPEWTLEVKDATNQPLPGVRLREAFQDYTVQDVGGEEVRYTDSRGVAVFPIRVIHPLRLAIYFGTITKVLNIHSSYGPHSYVFAVDSHFSDGYNFPKWDGGKDRHLKSTYLLVARTDNSNK